MATPVVQASIGAEAIDAARRALDLPDGTPTSQIVRAAVLRIAGHPDTDGSPANRGGRPKGYSPKRAAQLASTANP